MQDRLFAPVFSLKLLVRSLVGSAREELIARVIIPERYEALGTHASVTNLGISARRGERLQVKLEKNKKTKHDPRRSEGSTFLVLFRRVSPDTTSEKTVINVESRFIVKSSNRF